MNDNQKAMQQLFDGLYNFVAPVPDPSDQQGQKSFYTQMKTGIDISDFDKKSYALMADKIPAVQRDYAATGNVSAVYQRILGAIVPEDTPSKDQQEKYEYARKLLSKDSEKYSDYKEARRDYQKACCAYQRLLNDANADPYDLQDAKMDMQDALKDFEAAYKTEIENALSIVTAYERFTPASVFRRAGQAYDEAATERNSTGYYDIDMIPNLEKGVDRLAWEELVVNTSSQKVTLSMEASNTQFSDLNQVSHGWWFWKSEDKASSEESETLQTANSKMTTNDLSISMEVAVAEISRPWFDETLLSYSEAYLPHENAGAICGGTLTGGGIMPIAPTAFVFVKNVKIFNQFSEEEKQMFESITDETANNLSYGPFSFSNSKRSFHEKISSSEQSKFGDVNCLELGEMPQLIGVISTVMSPQFPMKSGLEQLQSNNIIRLTNNPIISSKRMWNAMKAVLYADELSYMLDSLQINSFDEFSGNWVVTLEDRIKKLNAVGGSWHETRDDIVGNFLSPFITYSNLYSAVKDMLLEQEAAPEDIITVIEKMHEQAKENAKNIRAIEWKFDEWIRSVDSMLILLRDSMQEGWKSLDVEEAAVTAMAEKLALLENTLEETMDEILPTQISENGEFVKSFGKIIYTVFVQGEAVTILSAASLFISVGSVFYEAISSHMNVKELSEEMAECKKQFSLKQQALAQTKALLQLLHILQLKVAGMRNEFDGIIDIWDGEEQFLQGLLDSYQKGADPRRTSLVTENAAWETNSQYAVKFLSDDSKTCQFEIKL